MSRKPEPVIAVLWGDKARAMNWIRLGPDGGTECLATADPNGFWMRNTTDRDLAFNVYDVWRLIQDGSDDELKAEATHRIDTSHYPARYEPIHEETLI